MSLAQQIVTEARSLIGVRWQHQGRTREGLDCIGLPILCANTVLGQTFIPPDYGRVSEDESMLEYCRAELVQIPVADAQPGDVVVLGFMRQRHMALLGDYPGGGLSLIHAHLANRQVVEARLDSAWASRILEAFRFPAVAGGGV